MKNNKKLAELIVWLIAAVIGLVLIFTGLSNPKEYFDEGENSNASSIYSESAEL